MHVQYTLLFSTPSTAQQLSPGGPMSFPPNTNGVCDDAVVTLAHLSEIVLLVRKMMKHLSVYVD